MIPPHPFRLRRLHNPDDIDTAHIPRGFRLLYQDEVFSPARPALLWFQMSPEFDVWASTANHHFESPIPGGLTLYFQYSLITPVNPDSCELQNGTFTALIPSKEFLRCPKVYCTECGSPVSDPEEGCLCLESMIALLIAKPSGLEPQVPSPATISRHRRA